MKRLSIIIWLLLLAQTCIASPIIGMDFDLEYDYVTALNATNFTASTQTIQPAWWLGLENEGASAWQISSITFEAPYPLNNFYPSPDITSENTYTWNNVTIEAGDYLDIDAYQDTQSEDIFIPFTVTRSFSGNTITGQGDLTTTVTVIPKAGVEYFEVQIDLAAAMSRQDFDDGIFIGTVSHVSSSGDVDDFEYYGDAHSLDYEWDVDNYTPNEPLTFTCTIHIDLDSDIGPLTIMPNVEIAGHMTADYGSENWVNNTLQFSRAGYDGSINVVSSETMSHPYAFYIPWIGVEMPQYVSESTPTLISVPDVANETEASARTIITDAGFAVTVADAYSHTVATGSVCGQNPRALESATAGSTVNLYLSIGPTIYVNKSTGNDSRNYISQSEPLETVAKAIEIADDGDTIIITSGSYPENITIDKPVTIKAQGGTVRIGQ